MRLVLDRVGVILDGARIVDDVSVDVASGERLAVLGPSGSGKSTLLRVVAGLQPPTTGRVLLDDRDVTDVPPHRRGVGLVFQDAALFPHRDVAGNVGFGPKVAGLDAHERRSRVAEALELVGLARRREPGRHDPLGRRGASASRSHARSRRDRRSCCSTSRSARSTGRSASGCRTTSAPCSSGSRSRSSTSPTTSARRSRSATALRSCARGGSRRWRRRRRSGRGPADDWVARFLGMRNVVRDGDRATVTRPEAVRVAPGRGAVVVSVDREGPLVRLRVRQDDGAELEAVTTATEHPGPGDRVSVEVDPAGVFEVPVWQGAAPG